MNQDIMLSQVINDQKLVKYESTTKVFQSPKIPCDLKKWLEIATTQLEDSEKSRINAEIEEHFLNAVDTHLRTGKSFEEVENIALQELGSATIANKQYRAVYFTYQDQTRIEALLKPSWWTRIFIFIVPLALLLIFFLPEFQNRTSIKSLEKWSLLFWLVVAKETLFWLGYLFESKIKQLLLKRFPVQGIFFAQFFVFLLATPTLYEILKWIPQMQISPFNLNITAIITLICSFFWLKAQLPLTLKAIRRLRA